MLGMALQGERIVLRPMARSDADAWVVVRARNRQYLAPFSPSSSLKDISRNGYLARLAFYQQDWKDDRSYAFSIFLKEGELIGGITINNIVRGAGQMATLGYWLDEGMSGKGYMTEAVGLAADFAFHALKLHRLQAGCLPHNTASRRVLEKCGFQEEGLARAYIKIDGKWQDHVIYALINKF
jgi:ribosomal-protein-alanine N-acetyltransferase